MLYPVELQARTPLAEHASGRGRGIRTPDFCVPNATLYQTELYPERARDSLHLRSLGMLRMTALPVKPQASPRTPCPPFRGIGKLPAPQMQERNADVSPCSTNGAPGEIRTPDHLVRSQVLYPTELRARTELVDSRPGFPNRRSEERNYSGSRIEGQHFS